MFASFFSQIKVLGGVYLGWGVGANDTANIFGPAVATNAMRYRSAVILASIFVFAGSVIEGPGLMFAVGRVAGEEFVAASLNPVDLAFFASMAAAVTITILTYFSVPASTSQASIGSLMGLGIAIQGLDRAEWGAFFRMFVVWVVNPVLTAIVAFFLFKALAPVVNYMIRSEILYNRIFRVLLVLSGSYGAYALGASHAAITTAPFFLSGAFGDPNTSSAALLAAAAGGAGMSLGVITYSRRVMNTIGKKITLLDPFSAFICVTGSALTVHLCKAIGVPVSTSQAMVGAVTGVGFIKGAKTVNYRSLRAIFAGWVATPVAGALLCYFLVRMFG